MHSTPSRSNMSHPSGKDLLRFALKVTQEAAAHYVAIQDAADEVDDQDTVGEASNELMYAMYSNCMLYQGASDETERRMGEEQLLKLGTNYKLSMVGYMLE